MSRESDDNLSSINSAYTDMYQETVKRFTRSSLSPEVDRYSLSRISTKSPKSDADRRTSYDFYLEATGRRRSSDHGAILTANTEQFIIGQKVWVGGIRPGQIAYIGETHFAPGDWAGVVLDEPNGKNDGCVSGKRYFQCEPKRGIFSRLTRLTLVPLPGAYSTTPTSPLSKTSPERSRTVSPTASVRSSFLRSAGKNGLTVGDRIIVSSGFGSRPGILRYLGETQFASGNWCGVELDEPTGKNDGSVDGIRYFECKPKYGVFVPIAKVSLSPLTKKTRLSRTGSRESLTSIGTMNSIATTNTSRMRMSAQRKSSSIKPVTSPKIQFSMQDLLREKQNHIEQLMIERDMDREDAQNQALQFQKNISELKSRISQLESKLKDEHKKAEDLQFSVDEATFCGDELNAQTQVYKEKIHDLELQITQLTIDQPRMPPALQQNAQSPLSRKEEQRLQEHIKYLQAENAVLQKERFEKDELVEKSAITESGIQNLRKELLLMKEENEQKRQQLKEEFTHRSEEKQLEIKSLANELAIANSRLAAFEVERSHFEEEKEIMRAEFKIRNAELKSQNDEVAKLRAELSAQEEQNTTQEALYKAKQSADKALYEAKSAEANKLSNIINELKSERTVLDASLRTAEEQVQKQSDMQQTMEKQLATATSSDQEKLDSIKKLETKIEALQMQLTDSTSENAKLDVELKGLTEANVNMKASLTSLLNEVELQRQQYRQTASELQSAQELAELQRVDLLKWEDETEKKTTELVALKTEIKQLEQQGNTLENASSKIVGQLNDKVRDLELVKKNLENNLTNSNDKLEALHQQHSKLSASLNEKQAELTANCASLESTNALLTKLQLDHGTVLSKCNELDVELRKSEEKCLQQSVELGDVARKMATVDQKCNSLSIQNDALQQDLEALRTTGAELQVEKRKLADEIAVKQKNLTELQSTATTERMSLETQIEELTQKLTNAGADFNEVKETLCKTKAELTAKNEQLALLEETNIKQELLISDTLRQQENLQAKYAALAAQKETLQNDVNTLRNSSTDSNTELVKLSQDIAAKEKAFEDLLDKSSTDRANLESQLQASQQRIEALCSQVETLTQELKTTTEESFKRFEQLKQEQEKSGKLKLELGDLSRKLDTLSEKSDSLTAQNENLQIELASLRSVSTDSNTEVTKLSEELAKKRKLMEELADTTSAERLKLESQLQELRLRLDTSQNEIKNLRSNLQISSEAKTAQASEFESLKAELEANFMKKFDEMKAEETKGKQKLTENFEMQLKSAEQTKITLDDAISNLQSQIELLQDELLKSQLAFRAKEEKLNKEVEMLSSERERLNEALLLLRDEGKTTLGEFNEEKIELQQRLQQLTTELEQTTQTLNSVNSDNERSKILQENSNAELLKLEAELKVLQNALELSNAEVCHKAKLAEEDSKKIEALKTMLEAEQISSANISTTNAKMSEALQLLELEKCETAHIFELFEMESDQNTEQLAVKISAVKQQLADANVELHSKEMKLLEVGKSLQGDADQIKSLHAALIEMKADAAARNTEFHQTNEQLKSIINEQKTQLEGHADVEAQLAEYKSIVDEMGDASTENTTKLSQLLADIEQLKREKIAANDVEKALKVDCTNYQRKLEMLSSEKEREIGALKNRIDNMKPKGAIEQNGGGDGINKLNFGEGEESVAQINFLHSIIADMQMKNDTLKAKIEALEALPTDFTQPHAFDLIAKRMPAPRLFCDICDEFDKHETEDCPMQASDAIEYLPGHPKKRNNNDPNDKKERKLPEPRKYCTSCEIFGHEEGECEDECF